jgi:hypothetical protein
MSDRSEPIRLYVGHRTAILRRLEDEGISPTRAEELLTAWEAVSSADTSERGSTAFWEVGVLWIREQLAAR